jgi:hypothetical protein
MSDPHQPEPDTTRPVAVETSDPPPSWAQDAEAELVAARAKAAELDERLDKLEDEALPKPPHPASIGGMVGT